MTRCFQRYLSAARKVNTTAESFAIGREVESRAQALASEGKDANQIAKILFDADPEGHNYGIGIVLDSQGQAVATSETLLRYMVEEVEGSGGGYYQNSSALMEKLKSTVLGWQRIPKPLWGSFELILASDAGTGAVKSAVEIALTMDESLNSIAVEELGWPAYSAIARSCRVGFQEFSADGIMTAEGDLPIYQAGPMNTTGRVTAESVILERADWAAERDRLIILDRAYPGFEFAGLFETVGYDAVMRMSYERQLAPFVDRETPLLIALSPTKCFRSFALRPAGLLLAYFPDPERRKEATENGNVLMRARGCSFEHLVTRAFVKAMLHDLQLLEDDHATVLKRLATAEHVWKSLSQDSAIERLFSTEYSGLFRNPPAAEDAAVKLYGEHIYPVFSQGRCRINVTGIPSDQNLQQKHVEAFAESCLAVE